MTGQHSKRILSRNSTDSRPNVSALPKSSATNLNATYCGGPDTGKGLPLQDEDFLWRSTSEKGGNKKEGRKGRRRKKEWTLPVSTIIMMTSLTHLMYKHCTYCRIQQCYLLLYHGELKWMLDSGCTDHITNDISDFSEYNYSYSTQSIPYRQTPRSLCWHWYHLRNDAGQWSREDNHPTINLLAGDSEDDFSILKIGKKGWFNFLAYMPQSA